jgi:lysophospholipase L1-like esterase
MTSFINLKNLRYIAYLLLAVIVLSEVILRIYNPFHFRVKGDHIILEANKKYVVDNSRIPVLDKTITHTKNNLGFRGPDTPANYNNIVSIIAIGGSTTECAYLDDSKTWTALLSTQLQHNFPNVWLNNAGLAGHSTFGHILLLKEHIIPLHPKYVLLLVGANDIRREKSDDNGFRTFLSNHSELYNVAVNIGRSRDAYERNLTDTYIDPKKSQTLRLSDSSINDYLANENKWVTAYEQRLQSILDLCIENNIQPVLITQPSLVGKGIDPPTGVSLEDIKIKETENGKLWWMMLERYNEGTRTVAAKNDIPLIDLATLMPKSSEYFYDLVHFTNAGSEKTAEIIEQSLIQKLRR